MNSLKFTFKPLTTYDQVERAAILYFDTSQTYNPFLSAFGIDSKTMYEESFKPMVQIIADQGLSVGMFNQEDDELMAAQLVIDGATEIRIEYKHKLLKARAAMFEEGKRKILQEQKPEIKFGELIESLIGVVNPKYMKLNLIRLVQGALIKLHISKGYTHHIGFATVPVSQHVWELMEVPITTLRVYYKQFEFEDERVFENLDFGNEYRNMQPCCLLYFISYDNLIEGGIKVYRNMNKAVNARL